MTELPSTPHLHVPAKRVQTTNIRARAMSASGKMSFRLHPDNCNKEVADFCGGREEAGVTSNAVGFKHCLALSGIFLGFSSCSASLTPVRHGPYALNLAVPTLFL